MNPQLAIPIAAVGFDLLLGDPRWLPHPVILIGRMIAFQEGLLRRYVANERLGGILLLLFTVSFTYVIALATVTAASAVHPYAGTAVSVLMAWSTLAARSLHRESGLVSAALERGDLPAARSYLSYIVGRDTADLDEPEIWRATVETVAENSSDGVIAPLFFLLLGGPPLAMAYKAVNTLDSMVGYKNDQYLRFGWASARCDDLANYLPARLTGLLMVLVSPLCGFSLRNSWRIMVRDGRNHASPNSGVPEAATAGALGVQLGGTNSYFGRPVVKPTIGDSVKPLDGDAWRGAVRLMYGAEGMLLAAWLTAVTVWQFWR